MFCEIQNGFRPKDSYSMVIRVILIPADKYPGETTLFETLQIKRPRTKPHALISLYPQIRANHNAKIWSRDDFKGERIINIRGHRRFLAAGHQKRIVLSVFVSRKNELKDQNTKIH